MIRAPRHYTIKIDVEVREQDDVAHFQPSSVTARAEDLGVEWVSANDEEALHGFFDFYLRTHIPAGMSVTEYGASPQAAALRAGITAIVKRALDETPSPPPLAHSAPAE